MRILFADDQIDIRELTMAQLERHGHEVVVASNGNAALQAFQREKFDVVLLDEEMPRMSGTQVLREIRQRDSAATAPTFVVAFTGNSAPEDTERLLHAGFNAVLAKPFRMEALKAVLPAFDFVKPPSERAESGAAPAAEQTPLDRVNGDEKLLRKMVRTFLVDTPKRMASLKRFLSRKDGEAASLVAHLLKGSISIFAPESAAADAAKSLQTAAKDQDFVAAQRLYVVLKEEIAKLEENLRGYAKRRKVKAHVRGRQTV